MLNDREEWVRDSVKGSLARLLDGSDSLEVRESIFDYETAHILRLLYFQDAAHLRVNILDLKKRIYEDCGKSIGLAHKLYLAVKELREIEEDAEAEEIVREVLSETRKGDKIQDANTRALLLGKFGDGKDLPLLQTLIEESDCIPCAATEAVARIATKEDLPTIREMLKKGAGQRLAALGTLSKIGEAEDVLVLRQVLREEEKIFDSEWWVSATAEAIGELVTYEQTLELRERLYDDKEWSESWGNQLAAITALGRFGNKQEMFRLKEFLIYPYPTWESGEDFLSTAAAQAIRRIQERTKIVTALLTSV